MGEISTLTGGNGFPEKYQGLKNKDIPFYKVGNLKDVNKKYYLQDPENFIDLEISKILNTKIFEKDTIIFAKIGEAIRLNRRAILNKKSCIDNNLMALITKEICNYSYIFNWTKKEDFYQYAQATTIPSLKQSVLEKLPFLLPPLEEQKEIIRILDEVLERENKISEILKMEEQINLLEKSILNKAFRGELGTGNINDVPALEMLRESLLEK